MPPLRLTQARLQQLSQEAFGRPAAAGAKMLQSPGCWRTKSLPGTRSHCPTPAPGCLVPLAWCFDDSACHQGVRGVMDDARASRLTNDGWGAVHLSLRVP